MNCIKCLSSLTNLDENDIKSVIDKLQLIIADEICQNRYTENIIELDIGIGLLYIKHDSEKVRYKFIPNENLEKRVLNALDNDKSDLQLEIERGLISSIKSAYKELF